LPAKREPTVVKFLFIMLLKFIAYFWPSG